MTQLRIQITIDELGDEAVKVQVTARKMDMRLGVISDVLISEPLKVVAAKNALDDPVVNYLARKIWAEIAEGLARCPR